MATLINRSLSLWVYVTYLFLAYRSGGGLLSAKIGTALLLAMACIWFPEEMGSFTGVMHYHSITSSSPAFLVCACGWLILVGLPLLIYYVASSTRTT
jgi:hypothetical protein